MFVNINANGDDIRLNSLLVRSEATKADISVEIL